VNGWNSLLAEIVQLSPNKISLNRELNWDYAVYIPTRDYFHSESFRAKTMHHI
jgi:hypothetical protein